MVRNADGEIFAAHSRGLGQTRKQQRRWQLLSFDYLFKVKVSYEARSAGFLSKRVDWNGRRSTSEHFNIPENRMTQKKKFQQQNLPGTLIFFDPAVWDAGSVQHSGSDYF